MTVLPDRLALLDNLTLDEGKHVSFDAGVCVMEATAWVAGEEFTDHPACVSPVIGAFLRSWNDALPTDERQKLKQYIPLIIGTAASRKVEERRAWMACDWLVRTQAPAWLRVLGHAQRAELLAGMPELRVDTVPTIRPVLEAVHEAVPGSGSAAWALRIAVQAVDWAAAGDWAAVASGADLRLTGVELQASVHQLIRRMIEMSSTENMPGDIPPKA